MIRIMRCWAVARATVGLATLLLSTAKFMSPLVAT
jgi:hypothetical protein